MTGDTSTNSPKRPDGPGASKSFSRMEAAAPAGAPRNRAKTVHKIMTPELVTPNSQPLLEEPASHGEQKADVFEKTNPQDSTEEANTDQLDLQSQTLPDKFIESLSARVYSTPPNIDQLSELFQEFYVRAATPIGTHISTLASRLNRQPSPSPSRSQTAPQPKRGLSSQSLEKPTVNQQMLTATEVAEKRKARKLLQYKQLALEEAVERRACESVYEKVWRHRSTLDEVRDEKLRSKTAALAVVGITMKDLGIDIGTPATESETEESDWLSEARQSLIQMNDEKFPLGKLQHLIAAHKAIVDSLTKILPSSSSADEILPILIYTLITTPPEGINIISNLLFVQRFRSSSKVDGEAAYCLTNLEAAISFLENVDLASLRGEDIDGVAAKSPSGTSSPLPIRQTGRSRSVSPSAPLSSTLAGQKSEPTVKLSTPITSKGNSSHEPSPQQRLTSLFQPPAKALGAANDAVRSTADQGLKNISNTLDNSFKFLFGRLKEVQMSHGGVEGGSGVPIVPKTLDDARRLVNRPAMLDDGSNASDDGSSKDSSNYISQSLSRFNQGDRLIGLIGGRNPSNDRLRESSTDGKAAAASATSTPGVSTPNAAFGSMRSFGNSLNPLNHIPGMIRGLGRAPSEVPSSTAPPPTTSTQAPLSSKLAVSSTSKDAVDSSDSVTFRPPIKRFLDIQDPAELKLGDIPELLEDYKRLALMLGHFGVS
ncbi:hypothetical protein AJ80_05124 [Polytolypa hystricis UAMH7299]|uniref:VPS9 domain-containing protein n=1 Tax=Polytolypa hystricis (strain UAMH7299) TaxID=1447883 RepID=A0A2B7Y6W8_POLH7|nr:hypothetical protein AJ80_05124 [Polytolypa hystricis UAMH7299]